MLVLSRHYARGLALLIKQPKLAQKLQARERQVKRLQSRLKEERQEVNRWKKQVKHRPSIGELSFGDLQRLNPISRRFGLKSGQPIDRYYIENFLASHADDIRGRVLEIADNTYTCNYGGERVSASEVLDVAEDNPRATIHADLTRADRVPSDTFDCIIFTQTLQLIYDVHSAVQTLYRILKPGGVLLATFPGISHISHTRCGDSWCWELTQLSARRLFEESFPATNLTVETHGNVLVAVSFLHGLSVEELRQEELDYHDPDYQVLITLRAVKPEAAP
jgi:SAM-dependent methyltransferase